MRIILFGLHNPLVRCTPNEAILANHEYDSSQTQFYINLESSGVLPPDKILHSGIRVLQEKLASVIQELEPPRDDGQTNGVPRSPDMMDLGGGTAYGGNTSYGNAGAGGATPGWGNVAAGGNSAWGGGGGGQTPYGATPYGRGNTNW